MPKEQIALEKAHRLINSGPVTLIVAGHNGRVGVMPASWLMPVSQKPPMLALAVKPAAFTFEMIEQSREFTVNVATAQSARAVKICGSTSSKEVDKLKAAGLRAVAGLKLKTPIIEDCVGHLECTVVERYTMGDHVVFVAEIQAAQVEAGTFEGVWLVEKEEAKILHHLGGSSYSLPKGRFDI